MKHAGLDSRGGAVLMLLPLSHVAGAIGQDVSGCRVVVVDMLVVTVIVLVLVTPSNRVIVCATLVVTGYAK